MILRGIILENIACYKGETKINFYLPDDWKKNVYLIGARSGSGKSTLFESIKIALYGDEQNKIKELIHYSQNELRDPSCSITLFFQLNEIILMVSRIWKGPQLREKVICCTYDPKSEKLSDVISGARNKKDIKEFTETYLPKKISQFFFFDGEKIQEIANDEKYTKFISDSVEDVLGITPYTKVLKAVSSEIKTIEKQITNVGSNDLQIIKNEISVIITKLERTQKNLNICEKDLEEKKSSKREKEKQLSRASEKPIIELKNEINKLNREIKEIDKDLKKFIESNLVINLLSNFEGLVKEYQLKREKKLTNRLSLETVKQIARYISTPVTICCNRALSEDEYEKLISRIVNNMNNETVEEKINLEASQLNRLYELLTADSLTVDMIAQKYQSKVNLEKRVLELEKKIENYEIHLSGNEREELEKEIINLKNSINLLEDQVKQFEDEKIKLGNELKKKTEERNKIIEELEADKIKRKKLKYLKNIEEVFIKFIVYLKKERHKDLENNVREMFFKLYRKKDLVTKFELTENYEIIIEENDQRILKENLAAGEKEIFALSLLWGLAKTSHLELPIIIDTPLSRLDQDYREKIIREYFPNASHQLILLSTDSEIVPNSDFYNILEPHIAQSLTLYFDMEEKKTKVKEGYFEE